jgi:hypothetical protein
LSMSSPASAASWLLGVIPTPTRTSLDPAPVVENDTGHRIVPAAQFGHRNLATQVHTVVTVQVGKGWCGLRAEHVQQRKLAALEEGDVKSRIARGCGGFQPDPASADDD